MTRLHLSLLASVALCFSASVAHSQVPEANYDEAKIPAFTLPDPLVNSDGTRVTTAEEWKTKRRPELLRLFAEQMYGKLPKCELPVEVTRVEEGKVFDGKAIRREVDLTVKKGDKSLTMTLLLYIPECDEPVPAFVGLNFAGNHTISDDPGISLNPNWMRPTKEKGVEKNRATEAARGTSSSRWPVEMVLDRGYALGTMYYGDIDPDFDDGFKNGIHAFCDKPAADEWGSIAAWAWGLSRILDYLETDKQIDATRVAVLGHSRLGKTSLWAGAADERFGLVISNDSGCGGAALNKRVIGESVHRINTVFPHWFCDNFVAYNSNEGALTFDQHELIALIAPRPVYVASASEDTWADPKGEYLSCYYADPVYRLLGTAGLGEGKPSPEPPAVDQPRSSGVIGYHNRTGKHDITSYDWEQYLHFADRNLK